MSDTARLLTEYVTRRLTLLGSIQPCDQKAYDMLWARINELQQLSHAVDMLPYDVPVLAIKTKD